MSQNKAYHLSESHDISIDLKLFCSYYKHHFYNASLLKDKHEKVLALFSGYYKRDTAQQHGGEHTLLYGEVALVVLDLTLLQ